MISLEGASRRPRRLIVVEHGGDETVTIFEAMDPNRRFSDDEKTRLFRVKPAS
jgi:hypothetical protein